MKPLPRRMPPRLHRALTLNVFFVLPKALGNIMAVAVVREHQKFLHERKNFNTSKGGRVQLQHAASPKAVAKKGAKAKAKGSASATKAKATPSKKK